MAEMSWRATAGTTTALNPRPGKIEGSGIKEELLECFLAGRRSACVE
jgi:hypothetical protein